MEKKWIFFWRSKMWLDKNAYVQFLVFFFSILSWRCFFSFFFFNFLGFLSWHCFFVFCFLFFIFLISWVVVGTLKEEKIVFLWSIFWIHLPYGESTYLRTDWETTHLGHDVELGWRLKVFSSLVLNFIVSRYAFCSLF